MKYFTKDLWDKMNDNDITVREQANMEWEKNCKIYAQTFSQIKHRFPRTFLDEFHSRNGFHDYSISKVALIRKKQEYSCEMELLQGSEAIAISLHGISKCKINIDTFQYCIQGTLRWGYSEFDLTTDGTISLAILCDLTNELQFEFHAIDLCKKGNMYSQGHL